MLDAHLRKLDSKVRTGKKSHTFKIILEKDL